MNPMKRFDTWVLLDISWNNSQDPHKSFLAARQSLKPPLLHPTDEAEVLLHGTKGPMSLASRLLEGQQEVLHEIVLNPPVKGSINS